MTDVYAAVDGQRLTALKLSVGNIGPWVADCDFEAAPELGDQVTLRVGELALRGSVLARASGEFGLQKRVRIVGGAGGWAKMLGAKQYHNDAGVKARLVAEDAAREVGEQLGDFVPRAERVGRDYVRDVRVASAVLEDVLGGVPWWVDYDGVTHAGSRPSQPVEGKAYTVLAYDPRDRIATLAVDDAGAIGIGSVLAQGLDAPRTVRELELHVSARELRLMAWCGGADAGYGQLAGLLLGIARRAADRRLWGLYRYRVVRSAGDRLELQAVRTLPGLPDLLPLSVWPGIGGAHTEPAPGAEVLVGFLEGDRAQPVVLAYAGKDGVGFVPTQLTLGGSSGPPAARQGDAVEVLLPPAVMQGTLNGSSVITGTLTFTANKALGTITAGSGKVRVA